MNLSLSPALRSSCARKFLGHLDCKSILLIPILQDIFPVTQNCSLRGIIEWQHVIADLGHTTFSFKWAVRGHSKVTAEV